MPRHVMRIFRSDFRSWVPLVAVVAVVSTLIGVCINQFVWTSSEGFVTAATDAGLDPAEFGVVSVTIYAFVALLTLFSLTIVGAATVERTRSTFAQWRLIGASPRQVRAGLWALVGIASVLGALPGSLLSIGVSFAAVPLFNEMAALSFASGGASFVPPAFAPSLLAWFGALAVAVGTCLVGALGPSMRAARVEPVEAVRDAAARRGGARWPRWALGVTLFGIAGIVVAGALTALGAGEFGASAGALVNAALLAGLLLALGVYALAPVATVALVLAVRLVLARSALGRLAARSAHATAERNANLIAPLVAAIGAAAVLFSVLRSYEALVAAAGFEIGEANYVDTAVLAGVFAAVSLLTSVAVMTLSGRSAGREQAILRTAGATPRQVAGVLVWQSGLLALCTGVLALIPVCGAGIVMAVGSARLVGIATVVVPWVELGAATLACWVVLFAVQWLRISHWLSRDVASALRAA